MTQEQNPKGFDQNELILSLLNSPDGKNIILEVMKLAGVAPTTDNLDTEQLEKVAAMDTDQFKKIILNNPVVLQKMINFLHSIGFDSLNTSSNGDASSVNLTQEQMLQLILKDSSGLKNLLQLTQIFGVNQDEALAQLAQLQQAIDLLKQIQPLSSDEENS
ncbi:hypothetical protein COK19_02755 [Bacillus cereus]|uniref:hypothetical protein n=1 Tax=Bacillus cereus TaxID=1396 RepID=UPI000BFA1BB2|nr:hypothetical protein [Bacillus cereus]PFR31717.1 hypothetical protein COK19_02755 [Bacillus cereus]